MAIWQETPPSAGVPSGAMITAARLIVIVAVAAPLLAWSATGSLSAAWVAGIIGGTIAYLTRLVAHSMRSDGRS